MNIFSGGKDKSVNHSQKKYFTATYVHENMPEAETILTVASHFALEIESPVVDQNINTYVDMVKLLQKFHETTKSTRIANNSQNKLSLKSLKKQLIILDIIDLHLYEFRF